eukprot:3933993-Rhodomonas_salina.2
MKSSTQLLVPIAPYSHGESNSRDTQSPGYFPAGQWQQLPLTGGPGEKSHLICNAMLDCDIAYGATRENSNRAACSSPSIASSSCSSTARLSTPASRSFVCTCPIRNTDATHSSAGSPAGARLPAAISTCLECEWLTSTSTRTAMV